MNISPKSVKKLSKDALEIVWSDSRVDRIDSRHLRINCPCAFCAEQRGEGSHSKPLNPVKPKSILTVIDSSVDEETSLQEIWAVGNYAIGCRFADGHASGIYSYGLLREIGDKSDP